MIRFSDFTPVNSLADTQEIALLLNPSVVGGNGRIQMLDLAHEVYKRPVPDGTPFIIEDASPSTGSTTGALVVEGGVGIGGDTYIAGTLTADGIVISDLGQTRTVTLYSGTAPTSGINSVLIGADITGGTGDDNVVIGAQATCATGNTNSVIIGRNASGALNNGVVIGESASFAAQGGVAVGAGASCVDTNDIAIGRNASTSGGDGIAIGANTNADGGVCIGGLASCTGPNSLALGRGASAGTTENGTGSMAIGLNANAAVDNALHSLAIGYASSITERRATAVGPEATAARNALALGYQASAAFQDSVAIGNGATATAVDEIVLGSAVVHTHVNIPMTTDVTPSTGVGGAVRISGGLYVAKDAYFAGGELRLRYSGSGDNGLYSQCTNTSGRGRVIVANDSTHNGSFYCNGTAVAGTLWGETLASAVVLTSNTGYPLLISGPASAGVHIGVSTYAGIKVLQDGGSAWSVTTVQGVLTQTALRNTVTSVGTSTTLAKATQTAVKQTAGGITTTLWASPSAGDTISIRNAGGGAANTIDGNGTNIEGAGTFPLSDGESVTLVYDGTQWTVF